MITDVKEEIVKKLDTFADAIEANEILEIDTVIEGTKPGEDKFKIVNHKLEQAFEIEVSAIIGQDLPFIIKALETGDFIKLYGVTRIVGYYSRIQTGWNKSKIGELRDRRQGNYWEKQRNSEKLVGLNV